MSAGVQAVIVALAVVSCAAYSLWRLLSVRLRLRLLDCGAALPGIRKAAWYEALRARTVARLAAGCGSCAPAPTGAASRKQTPGALRR